MAAQAHVISQSSYKRATFSQQCALGLLKMPKKKGKITNRCVVNKSATKTLFIVSVAGAIQMYHFFCFMIMLIPYTM